MESKKPGRGGYRPGAGRKPKQKPADFLALLPEEVKVDIMKPVEPVEAKPVEQAGIELEEDKDPLVMLERIMLHPGVDIKLRVDAMKAMLPYLHFKKGEGGKKDRKQTEAEKAAGGKFAAAATPPTLLRKVA